MDTRIKTSDLNTWGTEKINNVLDETRRKLFDLRMSQGTGTVTKPHLKSVYRQNLAKIIHFNANANNSNKEQDA